MAIAGTGMINIVAVGALAGLGANLLYNVTGKQSGLLGMLITAAGAGLGVYAGVRFGLVAPVSKALPAKL